MTVRLVLGHGAGTAVVAEARRQQEAAGAAGTGWSWLLDGSALPRPDSLAALLDAAGRADASLLASAVLDERGRLAHGHEPLLPRGDGTLALTFAPLRILPVRAVSGASVLVRGDAPPGAAYRWTATLLREGRGFLVPASVATALRPGSGHHRLLLSGGLTARERLRLLAAVLERRSAGPPPPSGAPRA